MINHPQLLPRHLIFILLCGPVTKVITQTSQNPSSAVVNQPRNTNTAVDSEADPTPSPTLSGCFVNTEGDEVVCRPTGNCVGNPNATRCTCDELFAGSDCGQLDLSIPAKDVFQTGISFTWQSEIKLNGFYSLFTRTPVSLSSRLTIEEIPSNYSNIITVNGLLADAREYLVCISHGDYLGNISNYNISALIANKILANTNANCGIAVTAFDRQGPYTLAAWGIAGTLVLIVLLLLVIRACCDCRHSERREELMAKALGKFDFLRKGSSKKKEKGGTNGTKTNGSGSAYIAPPMANRDSGIHNLGV